MNIWTGLDIAAAVAIMGGSMLLWLGLYLFGHPRRFLADASTVFLTAGIVLSGLGYFRFLLLNDGSLRMLLTVELLGIMGYLLHLLVLMLTYLGQCGYFWIRQRLRRKKRIRRMGKW